jgi:creatinine amidohydrolase/Fe(II)-dependent formamide hydrolase-like protein
MGSDPGQATPEKGGEILAVATLGLINDLRAFEAEVPPAPYA